MDKNNNLIFFLRTFKSRILGGLLWNSIASLALQGSVLLSSILAARILGLNSFGGYTLLVSGVMTVSSVAQGGTGIAAAKFVGENFKNNPIRVASALRLCRIFTFIMGALTGVIIFSSAPYLAKHLFDNLDFAPLIRLASIACFFQISVAYQFSALQGFGAFKELSKASIFSGIAHVILVVSGSWTANLIGSIAGFTIASAARSLIFAIALRKTEHLNKVPKDVPFERSDVKSIVRFALPASLAGLIVLPVPWSVNLVLARIPNGLEMVAVITVAHQIRQAVLQLPLLMNSVSFSVLSRMKSQNEKFAYNNVFYTNLAVNFTFSFAAILIVNITKDSILSLYGADFSRGQFVLSILLISVLPEVLAVSLYQLVQSVGRMWHSLFFIVVPRDISYLALSIVFLPSFGPISVAYCYLVAQVIGLLTTFFIAKDCAKKLNFQLIG